jgi:membrane associated rhomboid family serine protease
MVSRRWPLFLLLAVATVLAFWTSGPGWPWRDGLFLEYGLSREALAGGRWWTWLTHALLHGSWWHALFNILSLWFVGKHLCDHYGPAFFSAVIAAGTFAGGLAQLVVLGDGLLIGISGGIMAMLTCAAFLWHDRPIGFGIGFVRLGEVKGKYLGWGVLIAAFTFVLISPWLPEGGVAIGHACHAGAALGGAVIAWCAVAFAPVGAPRSL